MTSEILKTGLMEPFLAEFNVWPDQPPIRIHGGGRSEVHRLEYVGNSYALRILHATMDREGIRYLQRVTDHLSRSLPEVPTLIPTTSGFTYAESDGWLSTLSNWRPVRTRQLIVLGFWKPARRFSPGSTEPPLICP